MHITSAKAARGETSYRLRRQIFVKLNNQSASNADVEVIVTGDDNLMVTSSRGGPGKFMVTSWLQIEGLQKYHEGDYTCLAFNHHNTDKATARVKVVDK